MRRPDPRVDRRLRHAARGRHPVQEVDRPAAALVAAHPAGRQRALGHQLGRHPGASCGLVRKAKASSGTPPPFRMGRVPVPGLGRESRRWTSVAPPSPAWAANTSARQLATWPGLPPYCRATPTECTPCPGMSVVPTGRTPSRVPGSAPTACRWRPETAGRTRDCPPPSTAGGAPGSCRRRLAQDHALHRLAPLPGQQPLGMGREGGSPVAAREQGPEALRMGLQRGPGRSRSTAVPGHCGINPTMGHMTPARHDRAWRPESVLLQLAWVAGPRAQWGARR